MANVSRIRGFVPSKSLIGAPWQSLVRQYNATAGRTSDLFIGDAVTLEADGNVDQAISGGVILGVIVAIGSGQTQFDTATGGYFNANDLGKRHLLAAEAGFVGVVPAEAALFSVYDNGVDLNLDRGDLADLIPGTGSTVTGNSAMALVVASNNDVKVVEYITKPNNDRAELDAEYIVKFQDTTNTL